MYNPDFYQTLFNFMANEYDVMMLESDMQQIIKMVNNLKMKKMNVRKPETMAKCLAMKAKGTLQKDIAKSLGISENTVLKWVRNSDLSDLQEIRKGLLERLKKMAFDGSSITDIVTLEKSFSSITRQIERYFELAKKEV